MKYYLGLNSEENFDFPLRNQFTGVGMIRGENLCINKMQYYTVDSFCNYVTNYLSLVSKEFSNQPVWYRTADLTAHQINLLQGCDKIIDDQQYLIGLRGVRRSLELLDTFYKEIDAFVKASKSNPNLGIIIPFASNLDEIKSVIKILDEFNYSGKIGIMVEIASMIFMLEELNDLGIENFTIGLNDLTTSLLSAERENKAYSFNNLAVLKAIDYITKTVHSFNKEVTLAGYLNKSILNTTQIDNIDIINIHYNEIPIVFDVDDSNFYTNHYVKIKTNYRNIKNARK